MTHGIECRAEILHLAGSVRERSLAGSRAAKVEPQRRAADARERLGRLIHRFGVHRAAVFGMRMRENDGGAQAAVVTGLEQSVSADAAGGGRFVNQRLEPSSRAAKLTDPHHTTGC